MILIGQTGINVVLSIQGKLNQTVIGLTSGGSNSCLTSHDQLTGLKGHIGATNFLIVRNLINLVNTALHLDRSSNHHVIRSIGTIGSSLQINVGEQIGVLRLLEAHGHTIDMRGVLTEPPAILITLDGISTVVPGEHTHLIGVTATSYHRLTGIHELQLFTEHESNGLHVVNSENFGRSLSIDFHTTTNGLLGVIGLNLIIIPIGILVIQVAINCVEDGGFIRPPVATEQKTLNIIKIIGLVPNVNVPSHVSVLINLTVDLALKQIIGKGFSHDEGEVTIGPQTCTTGSEERTNIHTSRTLVVRLKITGLLRCLSVRERLGATVSNGHLAD